MFILVCYRVQGHDESYHPDDLSGNRDLVHESGGVAKEHKFIAFESQLMQLFQRCHSCGLEVKLETSIRGTLLLVNGVRMSSWTCTTLAIPANDKGYGSWEFAIICSYSTLWSHLHWYC